MPESIYKFQPDRTVYLRGLNTFAAAASVHSASPTGFTVSGTFRDPADFAVVVLYDADNYYEHPLIKYLPDFNLAGLTLDFNLNYSDGLQPIDSPKFNWIDWATLDCIREDGTKAQIRLLDNAMLVDSAFPPASVTCSLLTQATGIHAFDRVTLWYQNLAFDYVVPAGVSSVQYEFFAQGTGTVHSITIAGITCSHTESDPLGESSGQQAAALIDAINTAHAAGTKPYVSAAAVAGTDNAVLLTVLPAQDGVSFPVSATDGANGTLTDTMRYTSPAWVATQIAAQVNATDWITANTPHALMANTSGAAITLTAARYGLASVSGVSVTIPPSTAPVTVFSGIVPGSPIFLGGVEYTVASIQSPRQLTLTTPAVSGTNVAWVAPRGGHDGNLIELCSVAKTGTLRFNQSQYQLSGGSSNVTWNCTLDFTALGIDSLRQCWLTFAPALVTGEYSATEWQATFSEWRLTGPEVTRQLLVAGPGSIRIGQEDSACTYSGMWHQEAGFFSNYFASVTSDPVASVTIAYICQFEHDLWLGTSLYSDRVSAAVSVDGDAETASNTQLTTDTPIATRRQARTGLAAGRHTVTLRPVIPAGTSGFFYFNFLEAVVASAVPDALVPRTGVSPALDFDTDHTYKLPPARIMWIMDKLGYAGPMNEYLGVFWWNQRKQIDAVFSTATVTFAGTFAEGDVVTLTLNGTQIRKSVFPEDTPDIVAAHFATMINGAFVGVWASSAGPVLTMTGRSTGTAYTVAITAAVTPTSAGTATITLQPQPGQDGTWIIDDTVTPPLNRASQDWHADFYAQCAARSREVVTSCSMELVNPPAGYAATFPDGTPVTTATGFGSLSSTQCAVGGSRVLAYQKAAYRCVTGLQATAGLTPCVQFGEYLWWFFPRVPGMAVGYASYTSPISIGTATAHGLSTGNTVVIGGVLGNTTANGTWAITVTDATHFALNGSSGNGTYTGGGTIRVGGMAFYDPETVAAAQAALDRPLHIFSWQDDDPGVNGGTDALFLRNRLRDHVASLTADIRSVHSNVICELLWPYDVNYPSLLTTISPPLGGGLNYFVNLPAEWQSQASSGLDRIKVEALSFGASLRNLDLAAEAIGLFPAFGWPLTQLRYLAPVFGSACPWLRDLSLAVAAGINTNNLWALDHICLYNLQVPEGTLERRSFVKDA